MANVSKHTEPPSISKELCEEQEELSEVKKVRRIKSSPVRVQLDIFKHQVVVK